MPWTSHYSALDAFFKSDVWNNAKLAAFDFDGVVGDTEPFQMRAFKATAEQHSPLSDLTIEFKSLVEEMIGKPEAKILSILKERHQIPHDVDRLLDLRARTYLENALENLDPNPFAARVWEQANKDGKRAVILSNGRSEVLQRFNDTWGISQYFSGMKTIDLRRIPDKVDYLLSHAEKKGIKPEQIVLLEDSPGTVAKAEKHGINAVFFTHALNGDIVPETTGLVLPCINPRQPLNRPAASQQKPRIAPAIN